MWFVVVTMIEANDPAARDLARAARDRPCADTIFALLDAGQGKYWLQGLEDALKQVGIAAASEMLGD